MSLNTIAEALEDLRQGKVIIVVDDEERENEGDFLLAAELVTPAAINFMITHGKGLVCMPMLGADLDRLNLTQMVQENTDPHGTAFTISVDYKHTATGISAHERALTVQQLIKRGSQPEDFKRPGHVFPLRAREGGVSVRPGHTEAAVDLTRLAGLHPAGVICEIIREDGQMARLPELQVMAREMGLKIISIADLIAYRNANEVAEEGETGLARVSKVDLPTKYGHFTMYAYLDPKMTEPHLALVKGAVAEPGEPVLVRVHSECMTGDVFGSERCDCGSQLAISMQMIEEVGTGILLYLRQEGRGIGLVNKLKAYELQEQGLDTVEANLKLGFEPELRDFSVGAAILKDLGVNEVRLLTNNPLKMRDLTHHGIKVTIREPLEISPTQHNLQYLQTKGERMGHIFNTAF